MVSFALPLARWALWSSFSLANAMTSSSMPALSRSFLARLSCALPPSISHKLGGGDFSKLWILRVRSSCIWEYSSSVVRL